MKSYLDLFKLDGKVVFVAGGAGLIGAEICRGLASVGAQVVILDIDKKKAQDLEDTIRKAGYKAAFEYFDIGDLEAADARLEELFAKYKAIDSWINVTYPRTKDWPRMLEHIDLNYVRGNVDIHLNSCIWTSRKVALLMRQAKIKGSIIHFGSIYGVQANDPTIYEGTQKMFPEIIYCTIKAGIVNLTRSMASVFGQDGIRVNCLCPGGIFDHQNELFLKRYEHRVPLKRMGNTQDIASVVLFLAADASMYMTGETVMVDGGWTVV